MASERPSVSFDETESGTVESSDDMVKLMDEFHSLYNEKLRKLETSDGESTELKVSALQDWVRDLTEQNRTLIKTVQHLEKNAIDRVDALDCVLKNRLSDNSEEQCKVLSEMLRNVQAELKCAQETIVEQSCQLNLYYKQNEDMQTLFTQAASSQVELREASNNQEELEQTIKDLRYQLCSKEKQLKVKTDELDMIQRDLEELREEAEKAQYIPKLHEEIGLLQDTVKEKDCILEQYLQEISFLKEELAKEESQDCKLLQLEDSITYYQQSLEKKELIIEKLKDYIKQLRQCLSQIHCQQERGKISRSSSTEYYSWEIDSTYENTLAGGDSLLIDELKRKLVNEKDMQIALTAEIAEKHDAIMRLKEHVKELEEQLRQSDMQTHFKDDIIRQLRKEVKLGRAKESLAEMLGLKGGPRAQMKAKIDHLHSELEEREIQISRLECKLEASRLPLVEAKVARLELELKNREKSVLTLCDKLDYVRRYLSKLRRSEEDINIKCGIEALVLELSEDMEWTRETRRNISIPLSEYTNESIIIISHRSHSLPDTSLQKLVQPSKDVTAGAALFPEFDFIEPFENDSLKEQISTIESNLNESLTQLGSLWDTMKSCELEFRDSAPRYSEEIQNIIKEEQNVMMQMCDGMKFISGQVKDISISESHNEYLLQCIEKCLAECLDILNKQKEVIGLKQSSSGSLFDKDVPPEVQYIVDFQINLGDSVSLLQQLKLWRNSTMKLDSDKTKEMDNLLNCLMSTRQDVLDKLYRVFTCQEEVTNKIFTKFSEFDKTFGVHKNKMKDLKMVLNNFIFNDLMSKNGLQDTQRSCNNISKEIVPVKEINVSTQIDDIQLKCLRSLRNNRLSRSSPSIGEEYHSDVLGDIHMKSSHLQQITLTLNKEIKSYLNEVLLREEKVRRFVCDSQELNKTLNSLGTELRSSENFLTENKLSFTSLLGSIRQVQNEVEKLLNKTDDFSNYKEMYDMNRSKLEQEVHTLQKNMFTVVSAIMDAIKASQEYDNNLLNSYRTKIQNYREKVEQLDKYLSNSIDHQKGKEEKEEEEEYICKLTVELENYQLEIDKLKASIAAMKREKESVELKNQKVTEELQDKICSLQAALQDTQQQQPVSTKSWFLSWPNTKQIYSRHIHDV